MDDPRGAVDSSATDAQVLRALCQTIGVPTLYLRAHEKLVSVNYAEDGCSVSVTLYTYRVRESRHRMTVFGAQYRMLTYRLSDDGYFTYDVSSYLAIDDPDFDQRTVIVVNGRVEDEAQHYERLRYEAQCNQPGTARYPLYNADRALMDPDVPAVMRKHWATHNHYLEESQ